MSKQYTKVTILLTLLTLLLSLGAASGMAEESTSPSEIVLEVPSNTIDEFFLGCVRDDARLRVELTNYGELTPYCSGSPVWSITSSDGSDAYFDIYGSADTAVELTYNGSAAQACDVTLIVQCTWGDLASSIDVPVSIKEIPAELSSGAYQIDPVTLALGESMTITAEQLAPSYIPADLLYPHSASYSNVSFAFAENHGITITGTEAGVGAVTVDWRYSNLDASTYIPVLVKDADGNVPNITSLELRADVNCDLIFTNYASWPALFNLYLDNYNELYTVYGERPEWSVTIQGDSESIVRYDNNVGHLYFAIQNWPTASADISVEVTCTMGELTASYTQVITVSEQGRSDFPGVSLPSCIFTQVGETITFDAQQVISDSAWTLPLGTPTLKFVPQSSEDKAPTLVSVDGTTYTWSAPAAGCYNVSLQWNWANYSSNYNVALLVADENGVYPDVTPHIIDSYYWGTLYTGGNRLVNVAYVYMDNFAVLDALYGVESIEWEIASVTGTDAEFTIQTDSEIPSYCNLQLAAQPTTAGEVEVVLHVTFDFEDDARNTTIEVPCSLIVEDSGLTLSSDPVQLADIVVDPGESFDIDLADFIPDEFKERFGVPNFSWSTNSALTELSYNDHVRTYEAAERGVFRQAYDWEQANFIGSGFVNIYVRNEDGTVAALPTFEVSETLYHDVLYVDGSPSARLATYTVANAEALYKYAGRSVQWEVEVVSDPEDCVEWTCSGNYDASLQLYPSKFPTQTGEIEYRITARTGNFSETSTYAIAVEENPGFVQQETVEADPIELVVGEGESIRIADLLPGAYDPEKFDAEFTLLDGMNYVGFTYGEDDTLILTATQAGVCKLELVWSLEHFHGYTEAILLIGEDENSIPKMPVFDVVETVMLPEIYIGGTYQPTVAEYTIPDMKALYSLYNCSPQWSVSIENDPDNLLWFSYDGAYSELLCFHMNTPTAEGDIVVNVTCAFNGETRTFQTTISVTDGPDSGPGGLTCDQILYAQVGQPLTLDAAAMMSDDWSLPTGAPWLELENYTAVFETVAPAGSVCSWIPTEPGAYELQLRWNWGNYAQWIYPVVIVKDAEGNLPDVAPRAEGYAPYSTIFVGGNQSAEVGNLFIQNYDALDALYGIEDVTFGFSADTVTGIGLRCEPYDRAMSIYITEQPTNAGDVTITATYTITYANGRASDTGSSTFTFSVADGGEIPEEYAVISREYLNVGDTCTITRETLDAYKLVLGDQYSEPWLNTWNISLTEDTWSYYTFQADAPGLYAAQFYTGLANVRRYATVYFFVADENGEYPEEPVFDVERTLHTDTVCINGNDSWEPMIEYCLPNAVGFSQLCSSIRWDVSYTNNNGVLEYGVYDYGDGAQRLRLNHVICPTETGEITVVVTVTVDGQSETFTETIKLMEGPTNPPTDLAADQVLLVKAGETFSIDAAALSDGWTLSSGVPTLSLNQNADAFELVSCENGVYTWKALSSGIFEVSFDWRWSNYVENFTRLVSVAGEDGVYPGSTPEFSTSYHENPVYLDGSYYPRLATVTLDNFSALAALNGYDSYEWSAAASDCGCGMEARLEFDGAYAYIDLETHPTSTGTATVDVNCTFYKDGAASATYTVPVIFTVEEFPIEKPNPYSMGVMRVNLNEAFSIPRSSALPTGLEAYADSASSWINNWTGSLANTTNANDAFEFIASESGIFQINFGWRLSNHSGYSRLCVIVADAEGNFPELPTFAVTQEVQNSALYIGSNTNNIDLADFTVKDASTLALIHGADLQWEVSIEGDEEGIIQYWQTGSGTDSTLRLYAYQPSMETTITITATAMLGDERLTSTLVIPVEDGPDNCPSDLAADAILRVQIGETFTIDAADLADDWTLPSGTPTLDMQNCSEQFELVSVEGSVYTYRALESGVFTPTLSWKWNAYWNNFTRTIIVADENGVEPTIEAQFRAPVFWDTLYVGGNNSLNFSDVYLTNYDALDALYDIEQVTWSVHRISGSDMTVRLQTSDTYAYLYVDGQPTTTGEVTIEIACTIDASGEEHDATYIRPVTVTVAETPFTVPEGTYDADSITAAEYSELTISTESYLPDEVLPYADSLSCWVNQMSPAMSHQYDTSNGHVFTTPSSGVYYVKLGWRLSNLHGYSRMLVFVADAEGNVPEMPTLQITETVKADTIYVGGNYARVIAEYTLENLTELVNLYGATPTWSVSYENNDQQILRDSTGNGNLDNVSVRMQKQPNAADEITYTVTCQLDDMSKTFTSTLTVADAPEADWPQGFADSSVIQLKVGETFSIDAAAYDTDWTLPAGAPIMDIASNKSDFELVSVDGTVYTYKALTSGLFTVEFDIEWANFSFYPSRSIIVADENGNLPTVEAEFSTTNFWETIFINGNYQFDFARFFLDNYEQLTTLYGAPTVTWTLDSVTGSDATFSLLDYGDSDALLAIEQQPTQTGTIEIVVSCTIDCSNDEVDGVYSFPITLTVVDNPMADLTSPVLVENIICEPGEFVELSFNTMCTPPELESYENLDGSLSLINHSDALLMDFLSFTTPSTSGVYRVEYEWHRGNLRGVRYVDVYVTDTEGNVPMYTFDFDNVVPANPIFVDGNANALPVARFVISDRDFATLQANYGYEAAAWEITSVSGTDATFRIDTWDSSNIGYVFLVDQPTYAGTATIVADCILDSPTDAYDQRIQTSLTINVAEWTGDDYTEVIEIGPYTAKVNEDFALHHSEWLPEGVNDWLGGPWSLGGDHLEELVWRQTYEYLVLLPEEPGIYRMALDWSWRNIAGTSYLNLHITDENGNLPTQLPDVSIRAESFVMLPGMTYLVDLVGDASEVTKTWTTGNAAVATVDESGALTAVAAGETTVSLTLTASGGSSMTLEAPVKVLSGLSTMRLPGSLTVIEDEAFYGTAAGYVIIPSGVTAIGESAFAGTTNLQLVSIPATVTSIPDSCFSGSGAAILCTDGSAAESFAAQMGIPYYIVK